MSKFLSELSFNVVLSPTRTAVNSNSLLASAMKNAEYSELAGKCQV